MKHCWRERGWHLPISHLCVTTVTLYAAKPLWSIVPHGLNSEYKRIAERDLATASPVWSEGLGGKKHPKTLKKRRKKKTQTLQSCEELWAFRGESNWFFPSVMGDYCSLFLFQNGLLRTHQWCSSDLVRSEWHLHVSLILTYHCMILVRNNPWTSCQIAGGELGSGPGFGRKQVPPVPQEEWELCISMLMEEEDKELPAELGTCGAASRKKVVMVTNRDCWWLFKNCICQTRLKHPQHSPWFASFCCFPRRKLLDTWVLPKCSGKYLTDVFLRISLLCSLLQQVPCQCFDYIKFLI